MNLSLERHLNALMALIISGVLWGALGIQFFGHEEPCPLCLLQRLGMMAVASGALMNVKFGIRRLHYGLSLLSAVFGGFVASRHFLLHVCPGFPTFGKPVWGLSLYTWSFLVFACSVVYIAFLFLFFNHNEKEKVVPITWFGHLSFILVFLAALTNIFATLWLCGFGPCEST